MDGLHLLLDHVTETANAGQGEQTAGQAFGAEIDAVDTASKRRELPGRLVTGEELQNDSADQIGHVLIPAKRFVVRR